MCASVSISNHNERSDSWRGWLWRPGKATWCLFALRTLDNTYFLGMIGEKGMASWNKDHLKVCVINTDLS